MSHEQPHQHLSANPRAENLAAAGKLFALLLSGVPSQRLAASGRFEAAERMIISRAWMERYKPESMRFIQAGALYERGEEEAARELLGSINPSDLSEGEAQEYQVLREVLEPGQT